jgi:serine/threonine protein kinase
MRPPDSDPLFQIRHDARPRTPRRSATTPSPPATIKSHSTLSHPGPDVTDDELTFGERAGAKSRRGHHPADPHRFSGTPRFSQPQLIGQGGMGLVYSVHDEETGQDVALKTLRSLDPDELYRLKQEFRVLAGILHTNLVHLYELFAAGGDCFLTMELLHGQDFVRWVRGSRRVDEPGLDAPGEARLRDGLRQLVAGLSAVHAADRLHRDIKPSNVLVTHAGVVKILDFGLATSLRLAPGGDVAGTPVYMAPELAHGGELGVASDWYSVGVMLYEAMTAQRPHPADITRLVLRRDEPPPDPRLLAPDLDPQLCELAMALLAADPQRRPNAVEILARLDGHAGPRIELPEPPRAVFVGREQELQKLRNAWREVEPSRPSIVHLHGPSGIGKSELIRHFLRDLEDSGVLVLAGRCLAQESVPYKALDAVVDALRHALGRLPQEAVERCRPLHAAPLLRVFPVLRAVPTLLGADAQDPLELHELRRRAFLGLRQLLTQVATLQPLAVVIDDLQWSDLDSIQLLRELLRAPNPPGVLLVLSWRSEAGASSEALRKLHHDAEDLPPDWRTDIELGPLDPDQTERLAREQLGPSLAHEAAAVAQESLGSPFFCGELARHRAAGGEAVRLADVVGARLATLAPLALALLEVVAVAGRPIEQTLALQSAGLGEAGRPVVAHLQQACLVRTSPLGERTALEPYHDRVRETIVARMSMTLLRNRHRTLAQALAQRADADPEHLITHHLGAGDVEQACGFALQAADRAAAALAFTRAAHLYQLTLDLMKGEKPCDPGVTEADLRVRLARVLAQAGRGAEAGLQFQAAAAIVAHATPESPDVLTLQRQAAEQFLHSGRILEGKAVLTTVLAKLGIALPATPLRAMLTALWHRSRLIARGLAFRHRTVSQIDAGALQRLDALWGASTSMALVHHTMADALGVRHLLLALELGEPSRLCRALGYEAAFEATLPLAFFERRSQKLLAMVAELAEQTGSDYDRA